MKRFRIVKRSYNFPWEFSLEKELCIFGFHLMWRKVSAHFWECTAKEEMERQIKIHTKSPKAVKVDEVILVKEVE